MKGMTNEGPSLKTTETTYVYCTRSKSDQASLDLTVIGGVKVVLRLEYTTALGVSTRIHLTVSETPSMI